MRRFALGLLLSTAWACGGKQVETEPEPDASHTRPVAAETLVVRDTVRVRDGDLDQRVARLELQVLERDAQIADLETRLEEARDQVVRAMAKLQSTSSRAEATSAMAEAELAIQSRQRGGGPAALGQAKRMMEQSTDAFNKGNYGGALYLANQAKLIVAPVRVPPGDARAVRGEVPFTSPVSIKLTSRSNVRDGPGPNFKVVFTLNSGATVTGYSYTEGWIKISDDAGRSGWVSRTLVGRGK